MKNKLLFMLSLIIIFSTGTFSQNYFNNYDGIPLIVYTWGSNFDWLNDYEYSKIKEMGGDVVIHPDLNANKFEKYRNANIKMVPYQTDPTIENYIAKYTDAIYTIWEAEGTDPADGEITLNRNTNNTIIVPGGIRTVNSLTTPGYIITGPGYLQTLEYKIETSDTVKFNVGFRLKVEPDSNYGSIIPLSGNNNNVCRIEATYNGGHNITDAVDIKASDFISYGNWKTFLIQYDKFDIQDNWINIYNRLNGSHHKAITDVEFRIYFYGLNYLNLYCDDVRVYDLRGFLLFNNIYTQQRIKEQAKNANNINNFTTNSTYFDTMVVAWFPVDEHDFLDNWACVKKVNELVKENNNGRFLMENISAYWNGRIWDGSNIYKIDEFIKRAQPDIMSLNNFLYDWPHKEGTNNYYILNIENATVNHLSRLNDFNVPFFYGLQTGLWLPGLERIPSEAQFLYSANLGLLFGAKGLTLANYFFNEDSSDKITANGAIVNEKKRAQK